MEFVDDDVVELEHELLEEVALVETAVLGEKGIVVDVGIGDENERPSVGVLLVFEVVANEVLQDVARPGGIFNLLANGAGGDGLHFEIKAVFFHVFLNVCAVLLDEGVGGGNEEHVFAGFVQVMEVQQAGDGLASSGIVGVHHQVVLAQGVVGAHLVVERPAFEAKRIAVGLFFGVGEEVYGDHSST